MTEGSDVLVVGCGIAGMATAVSALQQGLSVTVLERASREERGSNTRWTEAFMRMKTEDTVADDFESHFIANAGHHLDPSLVAETAGPSEAWSAIVRSLSFTDPEVIGTFAEQAGPTLAWLKGFGIRFSDMPSYLITQSTTRICPVGGGLQLIETLGSEAERRGARFHHHTTAKSLITDDAGRAVGVRATDANGETRAYRGRSVVLACGGFEGNAEMQARYFGPLARYVRPVARGGYYNKGEGIAMALAIGAAPCGDYTQYHAEPIDPRSGRSEPIVFVFPYGILVNRLGERFIDEASAAVDAIYEEVSRTINRLPGGIAYALCDAGLDDVPNWQRTVRSDQPPVEADSLEALAGLLDLPAEALARTVEAYNAATVSGPFKPLEVDGLSTLGLEPPKSNWARPLQRPPYRAWPIISANCFTFGGLRCNSDAQVLDTSGVPIPGLYAVGETMGLYYGRYTGATSVLRGAVFGRLAGEAIARSLVRRAAG